MHPGNLYWNEKCVFDCIEALSSPSKKSRTRFFSPLVPPFPVVNAACIGPLGAGCNCSISIFIDAIADLYVGGGSSSRRFWLEVDELVLVDLRSEGWVPCEAKGRSMSSTRL